MRRPRLFLCAAVAAAGLACGCDQQKADLPPPPTPGQGRSNAVVAPPSQGAGATATASAATASATAATAAPRNLCVGQSPRPAPAAAGLTVAAAQGAERPPKSVAFGVGKWVWVNLWAAWCKPCLEEMPRLLGWQQKLRASGVLVDLAFVSLDDDERQLSRFLDAQPGNGVRASYWAPEGPQREGLLRSLGVKEATELPVHALVAPSGQLACVIQGAVEDGDYPAIAALLEAKK